VQGRAGWESLLPEPPRRWICLRWRAWPPPLTKETVANTRVLSVTDGEILAAVGDIGRVRASRRCRRGPSRASRPSPGLLRPGGRSDHLRALGRRYPVPPHSWRPASWHLDRSIRRPSGGPVPVERKTEGYWDQRSAATWKTSSSRPAVAAMRAPTGFRGAASDPHLTPNQGKEDR
jgi:hypothetical protein